MKYFTPELYVRGQADDDETQHEVDRLWDEAVERYDEQLQRIRPELPDHIRFFLDELLLHDADVYSMARQPGKFIMVLRKDIPPRDLVILTYTLLAEPVVNPAAFPSDHKSHSMLYMYNELDLVHDGDQAYYTESILFGNGWEVQLKFSDVQVTLAQPVFPPGEVTSDGISESPLPQSA
jgi:hypothetical protein